MAFKIKGDGNGFLQTFYFLVVTLILPEIIFLFYDLKYNLNFSFLLSLLLGMFFSGLVASVGAALVLFLPFTKIYRYTISFIVGFLSLSQFIQIIWFGSRPNSSVFAAIFASNLGEASDFLSMYLSPQEIFYGLLYFGVLIVLYVLLNKINYPLWIKRLTYVFLGVLVLTNIVLSPKVFRKTTIQNTVFSLVVGFLDYSNEMKEFHHLKAISSSRKLNVSSISKNDSIDETVVIVIGESVDRNNMGLYGYHRNTTPMLEKEELILARDVVSSHTHTIQSLLNSFVIKQDDSSAVVSIIDIARSGGYKTFWISNQPMIGKADTPVGVLASLTDSLVVLNIGQEQCYDEHVLPVLKSLTNISCSKKIIFVHLYGSHSPYHKRFPRTFSLLNDSTLKPKLLLSDFEREILNNYDTSIKYTDSLISEMIQILKGDSLNVNSLLFFSDHGEEVYDFRHLFTHHAAKINPHTVEIPFIFWGNSKYKTFYKNEIKALSQNEEKPYILSLFPSTFLDITHLRHRTYTSEESMFSQDYRSQTARNIAGAIYEEDLSPLLVGYANDTIFSNEVWLHHCNSFEKLDFGVSHYDGVELDLVFRDKRFFDVNHPPEKSQGITLEKYLNHISNNDSINLWFDIKNLNVELSELIFKRIDLLLKQNNIRKRRVLIESVFPEALIPFAKNGYITSYYLPNLDDLNYESILPIMETAKKFIVEHGVTGISQSIEDILYAKIYLPDVPKFTWTLSSEPYSHRSLNDLEHINNDNKDIKVILVSKH